VIATLGGPGLACSAHRIRRLEAGELEGAERARAEDHLAGCSRCQATQAEMEAERAALERSLPFDAFAAGVAERMAAPARAGWRRALPLALAAGLAALVVAPWALRTDRGGEEMVRTKGAASLAVYVQVAGGARLLGAGEPLPRGARLRLSLQPAGKRHAAVVLADADGATLLWAGPAVAGPLPDAFEWTGSGGEGMLLAVLSDEPIDAAALASRIARGGAAAAPAPGLEVVVRPLRREGP